MPDLDHVLAHQHGLVTTTQARLCGLTDEALAHAVRRGELVRVRRGVYADAGAWARSDRERHGRLRLRTVAAHLSLRVPHVMSHDSAALLLGLGVPWQSEPLAHVTRQKVHGDRARAGIKHHLAPYSPEQVLSVGGIALLDHARTAVDLAREHGLGAGMAACDEALRWGVPRTALTEAAESMSCWPGVRTVRQAIEYADPGAESYLESLGRLLVIELGHGMPETQFGLSDGLRTVWCDLRLGRHVFEVDGRVKYGVDNSLGLAPEEVLWREKTRQDFITGFKLGLSRITAKDVYSDREAALRRLAREYRSTVDRWGHELGDLASYVVRRRAA